MADSFWGDAAHDMHKTASSMAQTYEKHKAGAHFKKAAEHYAKAAQAHDSGKDDETVVKHWDRGDKVMAKAEKMVKEDVETELDEISRATLERYRSKAKTKFRAKGGINAALEKQDRKDKDKNPNRKRANESLVDMIMTMDEIPYAPFRDTIETKMNGLVDEKKQEMKQSLFDFAKAAEKRLSQKGKK